MLKLADTSLILINPSPSNVKLVIGASTELTVFFLISWINLWVWISKGGWFSDGNILQKYARIHCRSTFYHNGKSLWFRAFFWRWEKKWKYPLLTLIAWISCCPVIKVFKKWRMQQNLNLELEYPIEYHSLLKFCCMAFCKYFFIYTIDYVHTEGQD